MQQSVNDIAQRLENALYGEPWFGRPAISILQDTNPSFSYMIAGKGGHSLSDLLWHMITWAQFTLDRLEKKREPDMAAFEALDWRPIDSTINSWENGMNQFRSVNDRIIALVKTKDDSFLEETVEYRKYNFRFLLNGLIEHTIYHRGQVAYAQKLLK